MTKWKTVRVRQELLTAVERTLETGKYRSLSEFVAEAVQLHLKQLKQHNQTKEKQREHPTVQEHLFYSPNHMWTTVTPEGNVRVGLSEYAKKRLTGITSIITEPVGSKISRETPFGSAKTWMFKFDLYTPVSGKIVKINKVIQDRLHTVNEEPDEAKWIAEIQPDDVVTLEEELRDLMGQKEYKMWTIKHRHFT